jgi:hypothetical protein
MRSIWLSFLVASLSACGAVYPEISAPIRPPPSGRALDPAPPKDLVFIVFSGAKIPAKTRDGRQWDSLGGAAPDPFAKLFLNDRELLRTPVQSNTLDPTWPDQKKANYRLPANGSYRLEVWDSNALNNRPICMRTLHDLLDDVGPAPVEIDCDSGAHVELRVEPAHARWGLGFSYELRTQGAVGITRVIPESPAARAGLAAGDTVLQIQGREVAKMDEGEPQSLINANADVGIELVVRGGNGQERKAAIKEGVIYPSSADNLALE